ncbi:hypothetical protein [Phenylobacterium sp.]|uniref:hypothetical protein n=1 Tax=Phenylobacterium sp. TaxID=1871053 RepID=UPI0026387A07|nr:hypothetical protein [Phenylobacterium sp.]
MIHPALLVLTLALTAPAARAAEAPALCTALKGLAAEAQRTGEPQRLSLAVSGDEVSCGADATSGPARAFCEAAQASLGRRPFPWPLRTCVDSMADDPRLYADPGGAFLRLGAKLGRGVRLDVSAADGARGRYDLVVWKAR